MYFAPGTSGSITAWLLMVLQEMTASTKTTTPDAIARIRPRWPRGSGTLMNGSLLMQMVGCRSLHSI